MFTCQVMYKSVKYQTMTVTYC